jgi:RHH-type proline utilization regulon transcriptional repressor/proline dehydrogenase/delta 1-pyrroline-5-carboxylate dehydrogenase
MNSEPQQLRTQIRDVLDTIEGKHLSTTELGEVSLQLAPLVLELSRTEVLPKDQEQIALLSRLMDDPRGQAFTTLLTDRAYRSSSKKRTVEQARYLLQRVGMPTFMGGFDKAGLRALQEVGGWVPTLTGTAISSRIRHESSAFILPDGPALEDYLRLCRSQGIAVNINHLGEEVLGEGEAERRVLGYIELLGRSRVYTMSVKPSSIASQLDPLAFDSSVATLALRLERIYRAAKKQRARSGKPKLVVLDMEAYRDVEITVAAFQRALSEPDLLDLPAGIALQTYLPETLDVFLALARWADERVRQGGAPIRVRLVKGANLAMERVEAALQGWRVPTLPSKTLVDANFKRVLMEAARHTHAVKIGLASHNLFDVCFGLALRSSFGLQEDLLFELLHGMADPLQRTLRKLGAAVLVYAPIVREHEFPSAIAYLVRRLEENTSPDNYLRHSFSMQAGSETWTAQIDKFRASCALVGERVVVHRRGEDRRSEERRSEERRSEERGEVQRGKEQSAPPALHHQRFTNEPDTDFSFPGNRAWVEQHLKACRERAAAGGYEVVSHVGGASHRTGMAFEGFDPSRPGVVPYRGWLASPELIERALEVGERTASHAPSPEERTQWLRAAAAALRRGRGELVALMVMDSGKRVAEADVEVSEAVDFAEYYAECYAELAEEASHAHAHLVPRGLTVVTPPWNFPLAIPLSGVFAALVAGNPVILKPALETPLVAAFACELLWGAGIPKDWLQLVIGRDTEVSRLITDPRTRTVVLTGSTATARHFLDMRPELHLLAETGGKNALYVSDMSDRELAIADVVKSAFGHSGQKCSALSQLILHREVYNDRGFRDMLVDAVRSLKVGSAWDLASSVTPLINEPTELQRRALTERASPETWLVEAKFDADNPRLVSPAVKWGVQPGSPAHVTEYFCPLLSVLCAHNLNEALAIANGTRYGLTAGIHSLDEREHDAFIAGMHAGNLYVNRPITGAIVRRQPFGGWKDSSFGPGAKAGGPNYLAQFVRVERDPNLAVTPPDVQGAKVGQSMLSKLMRRSAALDRLFGLASETERAALATHCDDMNDAYTSSLAIARDESGIRGETNVLRYVPRRRVTVWVTCETPLVELARLLAASIITACPVSWFGLDGVVPPALAEALGMVMSSKERNLAALEEHLEQAGSERLRVLGPCPAAIRRLTARINVSMDEEPLNPLPRLELLTFLREQSVSNRYHRYGYLGSLDPETQRDVS